MIIHQTNYRLTPGCTFAILFISLHSLSSEGTQTSATWRTIKVYYSTATCCYTRNRTCILMHANNTVSVIYERWTDWANFPSRSVGNDSALWKIKPKAIRTCCSSSVKLNCVKYNPAVIRWPLSPSKKLKYLYLCGKKMRRMDQANFN